MIQVGPAHASGGIADVMRAIDEWAAAKGLSALVINTSCDGSFAKRLVVGVLGIARAVVRIAGQPRALVHVHSASYGSFLRKSVVVLGATALGRPVVLHIHGAEFSLFTQNGSALRRACISLVLKRAGLVLVLNEDTRRLLSRLQPRADVRILANPATMVCGVAADLRSRQILFLGRLEHRKGVDVLMDAIRMLQVDGVDADFVLAGDGDIDAVRLTVSALPDPTRVQVPGWLDSGRVHELLHASSIFCLPSRHEGLPMALLQAMGHGLACVVTPVGGMGEVIAGGVNGILIPEGAPDALAGALADLLGSRELREHLGQNAFASIQRDYIPEVVMARLEQTYQAALARKGWDAAIP